MAHEVETMAYANAVPWHGLGERVDQTVTVEEMQKAAGLDWTLDAYPLTIGARTPEGQEMPDFSDHNIGREVNRVAHVRSTDGKVMTVSDPRWKAVQPAEVLGFMRDYVQAGAATLETAGSLRGGKVVWGLARLNHDFEVRPGDRVNGYLLFTTPNEVGKATTIRTTTVRVVCANTMALANKKGMGETHYRQGHMGEFDLKGAKEAVGNAHEQLAEAERNARKLDKLKLSIHDSITKVLVPVFFPQIAQDEEALAAMNSPEAQPKKLQEILSSIENSPGADVSKGTAWGMLNGVTHWADHVAGRSNEARLQRAWLGDNSLRKLQVEQKLLELAS